MDEEGDIKSLFKIVYSKSIKWFVAKSVKEEKKKYDHVKYIVKKILKHVKCGKISGVCHRQQYQIQAL